MLILGEAGLPLFQILIWPGGGAIGMILWVLSIITLAIIVQNIIAIRRQNIVPDDVQQQLREGLNSKKYREVMEATATQPDTLSYIVHAALSEAAYGYNSMERALIEAGEERSSKMLRYTEWLNLLGNVGPMVGLLGTVWGLIKTFFSIVASGGIPNPGELAGAIGIKLVCTLLGLCIAIPALAVYGAMRNKIDTLNAEALVVGRDLISGFRPGRKSAAGASAATPPPAPAANA